MKIYRTGGISRGVFKDHGVLHSGWKEHFYKVIEKELILIYRLLREGGHAIRTISINTILWLGPANHGTITIVASGLLQVTRLKQTTRRKLPSRWFREPPYGMARTNYLTVIKESPIPTVVSLK